MAGQDDTPLNDEECKYFYLQQFHLAGAQARTLEDWRNNADFWRWAAIATMCQVVGPKWMILSLKREVKGENISQEHIERFKAWIMAEISASVDRIKRDLPPLTPDTSVQH